MGNKNFNVVQYGMEATRGTAIAADRIWGGMAPNNLKIGSDVKPTFIEEMNNVRTPLRRAKVYQKQYRGSLTSQHTTFQQLLFPLSCGVKGSVAASEQTPAQSDYLWAFAPSMTSTLNAQNSATIELSDDVQNWEVEYCMFDKIVLAGGIDQEGGDAAVTGEFSYFGRQLTKSTKTAGLSLPTGEIMNSKLARLYLDTAWAGVGGTELSNLLRSWQIEIITGLHPDSTGSANDYFNAHKEGEFAVMGQFTIEGGTAAVARLDEMRAATFGVVRLAINGSQIGTGDTHNLSIDIGGFIEAAEPIDGEDRSDNLASFSIKGTYDTTGAKMFDVNLTTDTSTWS